MAAVLRQHMTLLLLLWVLAESGKSKQNELHAKERDDPGGGALSTAVSSTLATMTTSSYSNTIKFIYPMKNFTKLSGGTLKLRCEVQADPAATSISWFRNEAPLMEERGRVKIRTKVGSGDSQWSRVRIKPLETMDTGFYRCEVKNGVNVLSAESMVKIHLKSKMKGKWDDVDYDEYHDENNDDEFGVIPHSSPIDFGGHGLGMDSFASNIQFQGRSPIDFKDGASAASSIGRPVDIPSLKPNERSGSCQRYVGHACSEYIGSNQIFVSQGLTQAYIEAKLKAAFKVIKNSPQLSKECAKYAIPAVCLSTLPLCDTQTQRPRKVCNVQAFKTLTEKGDCKQLRRQNYNFLHRC